MRRVPRRIARNRAAEQFWYEQKARRCVVCKGQMTLTQHHVVYRQHVRREGGNVWDVRNGMTLCNECHGGHHARAKVLPLSSLPDAAVEFAVDLMGEAAYDYLRRYYSGDDARVNAILKAAA